MSSTSVSLCALAASALSLLVAQPCAAQVGDGDGLGDRADIVVTAQRRPERAGDVPISLTALPGDQLQLMTAGDVSALDRFVPSLVMMRTGAFTQPYLRGVGKRSTLGIENSVAIYLDGVYLASASGSLMDFIGVERVEVLNGPQGTLFGRNATGGVIQIVTRDPEPGASGEALLLGGTHGHLRGDLYLSGGNESSAANLALSLSRNDGYGTNLFTGRTDQAALDHGFVGRAKWILRPADTVRLAFAADYQDLDQEFSFRPVPGYVPLGRPRAIGFRDGDQDASSRHRFRFGGVSARADVGLGTLSLMSLTALRALRVENGTDLDLGPDPLFAGFPTSREWQFSQEWQLHSAEAAPLRWTAGLFFIRNEGHYDPIRFTYGGAYSARLGGRIRQTLFSAGIASAWAAYGQATLPLGAATRLTLGGRYTIERRSVRAEGEWLFDNPPFQRPIPGLPLPGEAPKRDTATVREPTWRLSLDHDLSDRIMAYVSASRGFQSGGWNLQTPQNPAFGPERLDDFEAGLKYESASGRLRTELGLFYYDYSDLQVSASSQLGVMTVNAAAAELYGLSLQLEARPDGASDLSLRLQLLETRFGRFPNATCVDYDQAAAIPYLPRVCDVTGNRLPFAPAFTALLGGGRRFSLGRAGSLLLRGNLAYTSFYYSEPDNVVRQPDFLVVDLTAEWQPREAGLVLRLWLLNATDARYYNNMVTLPTAGAFQQPAAPRRFGATLVQHF